MIIDNSVVRIITDSIRVAMLIEQSVKNSIRFNSPFLSAIYKPEVLTRLP